MNVSPAVAVDSGTDRTEGHPHLGLSLTHSPGRRALLVAVLCLLGVGVPVLRAALDRGGQTQAAARPALIGPSAALTAPRQGLGARRPAIVHSWSMLPTAARAAVSRGLGADSQAYWAKRTATGAILFSDRPQNLQANINAAQVALSGAHGLRLGLSAVAVGRPGGLTQLRFGAPAARHNRVVLSAAGTTEWFANGPLGIEQGFTIAHRPSGHGSSLIISEHLSGSVGARVQAGALGVTFTYRGGSLRYTGLVVTDAAGRPVQARLGVVGRSMTITVRDAGARYPLRVDPVYQTAVLTASDGGASNYLGDPAMAISGSTIAVSGCYSTANGHPGQGGVYVYTEPASGGWANATQTAKLTAADGAAGDYLGCGGVAMSGSMIAAGSYDHTVGSHAYQGAVYEWTEPAGGWANATQTAELTASDGATNDNLSYDDPLLFSGSTIVTASYAHNGGRGAVYVWTMPATGWANATQTAELTASDGAADDYLGYLDLAMSGSTIVAASYEHTVGSHPGQGALYVWTEPAGGWVNATQTAELTTSDGANDDYLGYASGTGGVAISGSTIAALAAYHKVGSNADQGAAYVWTEPAGGWVNATQSAELTASDGAASDYLGYDSTVEISGSSIATASYYHKSDQGEVYVWTEPAGGWVNGTQTAELTASDGAASSGLGYPAIVFSGTTIIAAADPQTVGSNADQGAVYVWRMPAGGWVNATQSAELIVSNGIADQELGSGTPIVTSGPNIVVDAEDTPVNGNTYQGTVYVFRVPVTSSTVGLSLSPASVTADGQSTSTATFTVNDTTGAPVSGDTVTITSSGSQKVGPVTAGQTPGTYQATITSTTGAGNATITATDTSLTPSVSATATLAQTAPPTPTSTTRTATTPPAAPLISLTASSLVKKRNAAKFKFAASGVSTSTRCALVRAHSAKHHKTTKPHYAACHSPKLYKHLKAGSYEFFVESIGPGGTSKPSTHKFRIA